MDVNDRASPMYGTLHLQPTVVDRSIADVPPEVFCQITDNLPKMQDLQSLALTSKGLRASCAPALYREISYGSTPWKRLFECPADGLPMWSRYVRIITCWKSKSSSPITVNFRSLMPVLENLRGLRKFLWEPFIDIDKAGELSLQNLEELELALESAYGATDDWRQGPSWDYGVNKSVSPSDHLCSPFNSLAALSESHPRLRSLSLCLNYPMEYPVTGLSLGVAPSDSVLCNAFPHLHRFSLKGLLDLPTQATLYTFVVAHASLRSFTCHTYDKSLSLPSDAFPKLEYLEGSVELLAAVCDAAGSPRLSIVEIRGIRILQNDDVPEIYVKRVFPKLPNLTKAYMAFDNSVTPEWLQRFGEYCRDLVTLSLHDPNWEGTEINFARAFSAFEHLKYLSTSRDFVRANRAMRLIHPDPPEAEYLALAAARIAPQLAEMTWGREKRAHVSWEERIPRVTSVYVKRRDADGEVVGFVELEASVASARFVSQNNQSMI